MDPNQQPTQLLKALVKRTYVDIVRLDVKAPFSQLQLAIDKSGIVVVKNSSVDY